MKGKKKDTYMTNRWRQKEKRLHDVKGKLQRQIVEMAERTFQEHRLPRDFAARCICGCERSLKTKGVRKVSKKKRPTKERPKTKTKSCGCGYIPGRSKKIN